MTAAALDRITDRLAKCRAVLPLCASWSIVRHYVEDVEALLAVVENDALQAPTDGRTRQPPG